MIISIRGTNGAGKSTLVRRVMKKYDVINPVSFVGRRKPMGYVLERKEQERQLFIPGHYEIGNGGIDTIKDIELVYSMIKAYDSMPNMDVLYEGKNMTDGYTRLSLIDKSRSAIIVIEHSIEECIFSVRRRGHLIKENTISKLHKKILQHAQRFINEGYSVYILNREAAFQQCLNLLGIGNENHNNPNQLG